MILCILYSPLPRYIRWVSGFGFAMNIVTRYHLISASALLVYQHNPQLMSWPTQHAATVRRPHEARGTKDEGRAKKHVQIRASALRIHDATHSMASAGGIRGCYVLCFFPIAPVKNRSMHQRFALTTRHTARRRQLAGGTRGHFVYCRLSRPTRLIAQANNQLEVMLCGMLCRGRRWMNFNFFLLLSLTIYVFLFFSFQQ